MSKVYDDLETMLRERGVVYKNGQYWEDSYDFGVWWRDEGGAQYRLTWIGPQNREDQALAGELYLVCLQPAMHIPVQIGDEIALMVSAGEASGMAELLCVIPPTLADGSPADALVEEILEGWGDACGSSSSVNWLRARIADAIENDHALPINEEV